MLLFCAKACRCMTGEDLEPSTAERKVTWDTGLTAGGLLGIVYGLIKAVRYLVWYDFDFSTYLSALLFTIPEGLLVGAAFGMTLAITFRVLPGRTAVLKSLMLSLVFFIVAFAPSFFYILPSIIQYGVWSVSPLFYSTYVSFWFTDWVLLLSSWLALGTLLGVLWNRLSTKP